MIMLLYRRRRVPIHVNNNDFVLVATMNDLWSTCVATQCDCLFSALHMKCFSDGHVNTFMC